MNIEIRKSSDIPIFKQVANNIADRIRSGTLTENERLPSVRGLAEQLNISFLTVLKSYQLLEEVELVKIVQGKGTFINGNRDEEKTKATIETFDWQLSVFDYLPRTQFGSHYQPVGKSVQFSIAAMFSRLLPNRYIKNELQTVIENDPSIVSTYGPVQGDLALRKAMVSYLKKKKVKLKSQDILVTNGSQQGIDLVARTFIGPGDVVVTEGPTYPAALDTFRARGATVLPIPMDQEGMNMDILMKTCEKYNPKLVYTIPDFQNPTGTLMSQQRREALLTLANEHHFIILEDDPWSEIYFEQPPPPPMKSLDTNGHVIYVKGLSKTFAPGCRIGLLTADGTFFKRLLHSKTNADLGSPLLTQKAIYPLFTSKRMEDHLKKLRVALTLRRDTMHQLMKDYMPNEVRWTKPGGGLNIWVSLPPEVDTSQLLIEGQKSGIHFLPGAVCYGGEPETHHFRLSFSYLSDQELEEGGRQLCELIKKYLDSQHPMSPSISL